VEFTAFRPAFQEKHKKAAQAFAHAAEGTWDMGCLKLLMCNERRQDKGYYQDQRDRKEQAGDEKVAEDARVEPQMHEVEQNEDSLHHR
jgi:hypothetical protein